MGIHPSILISLVLCGLLLINVIVEGQLARMFIRGIIGSTGILWANSLLPAYMFIPLNLWTILLSVCVGVPGIVALYLLRFILFYL